MGSRNWQAMAVAGLTAFALACGGGDQAAENGDGGMQQQTPEPEQQMEMPENMPEGVTMEMVTQGRTLFAGSGGCAACHNPEATGTQLAPDLTDGEWLNISGRNYDEMVSLIKSGVQQPVEHPGPMPPMGGANLSDAQVDALAAYIMTLGS